jgi:hypothetical protein
MHWKPRTGDVVTKNCDVLPTTSVIFNVYKPTVVEANVPVAAPVEHAEHVHALHLLTRCHAPAALDALFQVQLDGRR